MKTISQIMPVVNTIYKISNKYNNYYCYPSQKTLQKILFQQYGIKRSISTLNRWLRIIEDLKYIRRVRRVSNGPVGKYCFKTTMYFLKIKGLKCLHKLGYDVWSALKEYYEKKKQAHPSGKKEQSTETARRELLKSYADRNKLLKNPTFSSTDSGNLKNIK